MEIIAGRYEIIYQVGRGSYGLVYKAKDLQTGNIVALKKGCREGEAEMLKSFDSPHIPKFYDYFVEDDEDEWEGKRWLVMELVEGVRFDDYRFKDRKDAIRVGVQLCAALRYLQSKKVQHGDFHKGNVLVTDENVYIIDFGFSFSGGSRTRLEEERRSVAYWLAYQYSDTEIAKWTAEVTSYNNKVTLAGMQRRLKKLSPVVV